MPRAKTTAAVAANERPLSSVDDYIARFDGWRRQVLMQLRELIESAAPQSTAAMKWSQPVWDDHGPFCFLRVNANHITLGFWRGADLLAPRGFLEGEGDRMRHIKLTGPDLIRKKLVQELVRAAVKLNRAEGSPTAPRSKIPDSKRKSSGR
ncbi:MAG: DUF1801 domain-containing protein [Bryobacterales bacterium]